jgi:hypothetical protein
MRFFASVLLGCALVFIEGRDRRGRRPAPGIIAGCEVAFWVVLLAGLAAAAC